MGGIQAASRWGGSGAPAVPTISGQIRYQSFGRSSQRGTPVALSTAAQCSGGTRLSRFFHMLGVLVATPILDANEAMFPTRSMARSSGVMGGVGAKHVRDCAPNTTVMQAQGQITDVKPAPTTIGARLKAARLEAGFASQAALAKKVGIAQSTIGNFEAGRGETPRELLSISAAIGVRPEWLLSGKLPKYPLNGAHPLGPSSITSHRTPMRWGELGMAKLQGVIEVVLEDDAMAPAFPAGSVIQFDTAAAPAFGNRVLIRDSHGSFHFRTYVQSPADAWEGSPGNEAFMAILPTRDGAVVVAVKCGHYVKGP